MSSPETAVVPAAPTFGTPDGGHRMSKFAQVAKDFATVVVPPLVVKCWGRGRERACQRPAR
jgi:hypothetical protein